MDPRDSDMSQEELDAVRPLGLVGYPTLGDGKPLQKRAFFCLSTPRDL
jgi:hypothetical protein